MSLNPEGENYEPNHYEEASHFNFYGNDYSGCCLFWTRAGRQVRGHDRHLQEVRSSSTVFPTVGKGGFGVGGAYGKGQVYQGGKVTGEASLVKLSIGWQAGGKAYSQMIFFEDKRAYDEFTSGSFEFDATASAVAITAGAQASAGTEGASAGASAGPATGKQAKASYHKGMSVFVHAKGGLMYEATIGGQKFSFTAK